MFVLAPLAATGMVSPVFIDSFRLVLAAAAVVLLTRHMVVAAAIIATILATLTLSISFRSGAAASVFGLERLGAATAFDLAVAWAVVHVAFGPGRVSVYRIMGAVILYLSIGLVFANLYRACAILLSPSPFRGVTNGSRFLSESLYFSLTTLTTTGYGDITPSHPFVRSLANLEAVIGQLFPATLLARLVSLHAADRPGAS
ncbi:MAG TPA: ion channel [Caulobacteraceae bacterium]|nr:ion channel [Caulobacteraceae bacterium]